MQIEAERDEEGGIMVFIGTQKSEQSFLLSELEARRLLVDLIHETDNQIMNKMESDQDGLAVQHDGPLIYHLFADVGVESEPLSAYGRVVRVGLDPLDTNASDPVAGDVRDLPLRPGADLALLHPPCQRWSTATRGRDPEDHPDLIPLAREIGREYAADYIIENVPTAPLYDPVRLSGRMFGLPIDYERAFETSFHVEQPPMYQNLVADGGPFADHQKTGGWQGSQRLWRAVKQVSGDYPAEDMKRSGIPAPYIHYLARWWLDGR